VTEPGTGRIDQDRLRRLPVPHLTPRIQVAAMVAMRDEGLIGRLPTFERISRQLSWNSTIDAIDAIA
jgi:hypothetical protein